MNLQKILKLFFCIVLVGTLLFGKEIPQFSTPKSTYTSYRTVQSIKKLDNVDYTKTKMVFVEGYHLPNDGGGGFFVYDANKSGIDNKGTVINGWVRQYSGPVNVKWFGAKSDGTNTVDAIQAAINSGAKQIFVPSGIYRLNGKKLKRVLNLRSDLRLFGEAGTVFDFSHNPIGEHHSVTESYISGQGKLGRVNAIISGANRGSESVMSATKDIQAGDLVLVYSEDTVDPNQAVKRGELIYVESVKKGASVTFETALSDTYGRDPKIVKVTPLQNISIENITFIGSGRSYPSGRADLGIVIQYGSHIQIKNCTFVNVDNTAVDLESVIDFHIANNRVRFQKKGKNKAIQYGIKYSNASRDGYIVANNIYNGKHGIVQGHTTRIPGISRNVIISGNNVSGTWHAAISVHASGDTITVTGNQLRGCYRGIESRIPNMSITDNILSDTKAQAIMIKDDAHDVLVSGNIINRSGLYAIYIYKLRSTKGNFVISNNIINHCYGGVALDARGLKENMNGIVLNANVINDIKTYGISIQGKTGTHIVANSIQKIGKKAISLSGKRSAVMHTNIMENPRVVKVKK